uniref:Uncharacterized protein n=1 Tax=Lepeophtheirus salmonis TaxID=72036 RepID=A0A0K2TLG0_LEPSM
MEGRAGQVIECTFRTVSTEKVMQERGKGVGWRGDKQKFRNYCFLLENLISELNKNFQFFPKIFC